MFILLLNLLKHCGNNLRRFLPIFHDHLSAQINSENGSLNVVVSVCFCIDFLHVLFKVVNSICQLCHMKLHLSTVWNERCRDAAWNMYCAGIAEETKTTVLDDDG